MRVTGVRRPSVKVAARQRSTSPEVAKDAGGKQAKSAAACGGAACERAVEQRATKSGEACKRKVDQTKKAGGKRKAEKVDKEEASQGRQRKKAGGKGKAEKVDKEEASQDRQLKGKTEDSAAVVCANNILKQQKTLSMAARVFVDKHGANMSDNSVMSLLLQHMRAPQALPSALYLKVLAGIEGVMSDTPAATNALLRKIQAFGDYPSALASFFLEVTDVLLCAATPVEWLLCDEDDAPTSCDDIVADANLSFLLAAKQAQGVVLLTVEECSQFADVSLLLRSRIKVPTGWMRPTVLKYSYLLSEVQRELVAAYRRHGVFVPFVLYVVCATN